MNKIKATFVGKDALGYVSGREYSLLVFQQPGGRIQIDRVSGGGTCLYQSLYKFIENWTLIKTQNAID